MYFIGPLSDLNNKNNCIIKHITADSSNFLFTTLKLQPPLSCIESWWGQKKKLDNLIPLSSFDFFSIIMQGKLSNITCASFTRNGFNSGCFPRHYDIIITEAKCVLARFHVNCRSLVSEIWSGSTILLMSSLLWKMYLIVISVKTCLHHS